MLIAVNKNMSNISDTAIDIVKQRSKVSPLPKFKIPGFGLQLDALGWVIVVLIIAAIVLVAVFQLRESSKVASTRFEMGNIENAVVQYEGSRNDGKSLDNLETLLEDPSITAANSIDNIDHGAFLPDTNNRWSGGTVTDMWGVEYEYSYDATTNIHTLTSTGSGKNITITF